MIQQEPVPRQPRRTQVSLFLTLALMLIGLSQGCAPDAESPTWEDTGNGDDDTGGSDTGGDDTGDDDTGDDVTGDDAIGGDVTGGDDDSASILEVYYGLDSLPPAASVLCGFNVAGMDGAPVTFSVQLNQASVAPEDFVVETATGEQVTPDCATLAPAVEPLELRTVLLVGTFGTPDAQPRAVEVVGTLDDLEGNPISGIRSDDVTPLEAGPGIVLAERYLPTQPGIDGECPEDTEQVVQLVWGGGVTGPLNARLGEEQRLGVSVQLEDGTSVQPIALADDDPDNFVYACLDVASPAVEVSVDAGLFHDPGDDANPATSAPVLDRVP